MTKYLTGRFSKILMLLVGVCLIGSAFHIHQLHPDYSLSSSNIPHHLSVEQPDCVACMNLVQAVPDINDNGKLIRHQSTSIMLPGDELLAVDHVTDLNNKSPPANCRKISNIARMLI
ncbi:MAG: hypothetical protein U5J63_10150 [Fodinibius sp.]|nr:hypothetical protein [Fodinibius sp.]